MAKTTFKGFSTIGGASSNGYKLYDIELIRQDLLNHFHTRVGERVLKPTYGCAIWDYLMEPFTEMVREIVVAEAKRICEEDPRVDVASVVATSLDHSINVELVLNYKPMNTPDELRVVFENNRTAEGY